MIFRILLLLSLLFTHPAFAIPRHSDDSVDEGKLLEQVMLPSPREMPDITFFDIEGKPHTLKEFRGKVLVLNFWATWCLPCQQEMPSLDALQARMKEAVSIGDVERQPAEVIAISVDFKGAEVVKPFFDQENITHLPIYTDLRNQAYRALNITSLPTTLIISPRGKELGRLEGAIEWGDKDTEKFLMRYAEVQFKE